MPLSSLGQLSWPAGAWSVHLGAVVLARASGLVVLGQRHHRHGVVREHGGPVVAQLLGAQPKVDSALVQPLAAARLVQPVRERHLEAVRALLGVPDERLHVAHVGVEAFEHQLAADRPQVLLELGPLAAVVQADALPRIAVDRRPVQVRVAGGRHHCRGDARLAPRHAPLDVRRGRVAILALVPQIVPEAVVLPPLRRAFDRRAARLLDVHEPDVCGGALHHRARLRATLRAFPAPVVAAERHVDRSADVVEGVGRRWRAWDGRRVAVRGAERVGGQSRRTHQQRGNYVWAAPATTSSGGTTEPRNALSEAMSTLAHSALASFYMPSARRHSWEPPRW